jgi:hypothetical protein
MHMILQNDNKGAKDLFNNWSVGGKKAHHNQTFLFAKIERLGNKIET